MKKLLAACLVLILLAGMMPAAAQSPERPLTLMIYMCGSNLESSYGAASADIQEMLAAAPGLENATVLIMTGGSHSWDMGYDASQTQICELGVRGIRVVWRSDVMNMGEADTLTHLLRFGVEKYPARDYALIMWNHGGGPLEGVCWDELFSMDNLSLQEMTGAIAAAELPGKLSWIGFDACLMCSIEVASALAPYAEYMIASQETEPSFGWNYSFLSGIARDAHGGETGRRIVDAYFLGHEDATEVLTLACLDLSKADGAASALDSFFTPAGSMSASLYTAVSGIRMNTTGFGKGLRGFDDDGYDLVDLTDLTDRLSPLLPGAAQLHNALNDLVYYSRSNITDANGVSIYHPYMNKTKFLTHWQDSYDNLLFSDQYTAYIKHFGEWLTGAALADWSHLMPGSLGLGENGKEQLYLQLSPEQTAEFGSAQLIIIQQNWSNHDTYSMIGTVPAQLNENGLLTAEADWRSLYVVDAEGAMSGPFSYELTQDGAYMVRKVVLDKLGTGFYEDATTALFYLQQQEGTDEALVAMTRVYDLVTHTFTNRISIADIPFETVHLSQDGYCMPEVGNDGMLPPFHDWSPNTETHVESYLSAAPGWHFVFGDSFLTDNNTYALFAITDAQQNTYCSLPIELINPHRTAFTTDDGVLQHTDFSIELSGYVTTVADGEGLWLDFVMTNKTDRPLGFLFDSLTLNGERFIPEFTTAVDGDFPPHASVPYSCFIPAQSLIYLDDIHSISVAGTYQSDPHNYSSSESFTFTFHSTDCSVASIAPAVDPLTETAKDGIRWQLLDVSSYAFSGYKFLLYIENNSDEPHRTDGTIVLNGIATDSYIGFEDLPAGQSLVVEGYLYNDAFSEVYLAPQVLSKHVQQNYGMNEINSLSIHLGSNPYFGTIDYSVDLPLSSPIPLPDNTDTNNLATTHITRLPDEALVQPADMLEIVSNDLYTIKLERIWVEKACVHLCLHIINHTDESFSVDLDVTTLNGAAEPEMNYPDMLIPAKSTRVCSEYIGYSDANLLPAALTSLSSISITITNTANEDQEFLTLMLNQPAPFNQEGGVMVYPDQVAVTDAQTILGPEPVPEWEGDIAVFMNDVLMAEAGQDHTRLFTAQLTEEQAAQASKVILLLVREEENGNLQLIGFHPGQVNEDHTISVLTTGMILCPELEPMLPIDCLQLWQEDGTFLVQNLLVMQVFGWDDTSFLSVTVDDIIITADPATGTAAITNLILRDPLPDKQSYMSEIYYPSYELDYALTDEGLPYLFDIPRYSGRDWVYHGMLTEGKPVQLMLRPITPEDQIYVMFSVRNQDGSGYTLPAMPFFPDGN